MIGVFDLLYRRNTDRMKESGCEPPFVDYFERRAGAADRPAHRRKSLRPMRVVETGRMDSLDRSKEVAARHGECDPFAGNAWHRRQT